MVEKQALLNKAFQKTNRDSGFMDLVEYFSSGLSRNKVISANKTLFSVLSSIIKAAPEDSLLCVRKTLQMVERTKDREILRIKKVHLEKLIKFILYDDSTLLSEHEKGFKGYLQADLIAYIEICRRIFFVEQEKISRKVKPHWMNDFMAMMVELTKKNHECAQYILLHKNEKKYRALIQQAENVMRGGDK